MPNFVVASNRVVEMRVRGIAAGQTVFNRFHYADFPGGGTASQSVALLDDFVALWRAAALPVITADYRVVQYELRTLAGWQPSLFPPLYKPYYEQEDIRNGDAVLDVGQSAGESAPTYVAAGFLKDTGQIGREWRGGFRLATIPEVQIDVNRFEAIYLTALEAAGLLFASTSLTDPLSTAVWKMVVFSLKRAFLGQPAGPQATTPNHSRQVLNVDPSPLVASQLSRKERNAFGS